MQSSHVETWVQNQSEVWKEWDHSREWWEQTNWGGGGDAEGTRRKRGDKKGAVTRHFF